MPLSFSPATSRQDHAAGAGVTAVLGPTNTGKTHLAIERMLAHSSGLIGLPLRLLAREVYNRIVERIGPAEVALVTGEEKIKPPNARYWVSTVEAMPRDLDVACVAIDEVQLGSDLERGHVFTDRMLHVRGREETLVLGAQTVRPMVEKLLPGAHILSRPRLSQLTYAGDRKLTRLPRRSAIVAFSADEVYAIAELIRRQRGGAAVVLGALSPRTRNAQVALYQAGDVDYLIATDAIGMGLNLDVDHVAFAADRKFDGYQFRKLNPAELAQIAGRAGRANRDGTFGTTGRCEPFEADLVQALESHSFEPIKMLQWRNTALDMASLGALQASLAVIPTTPGLTRAPIAEDIQVLEHAVRDEDVRALAHGAKAVARLWDVCQIPDYRKISPSAHAELVIALYGFLMRQGSLPTDWFARQIAFADRTDGDIDTLSTRIAHIRTWTFAANRPDWLDDPEHWQAIARGVEDKLSDALHERLLHRFVDRRTSVLMRRLRENAMLETEISKTGEVLVEGHPLGRLEGFRFAADANAGGSDAKALRSAAQKGLASEIGARATRLAAATDEQFVLASDGTIRWLGDAVGKIAAGEQILKPRVRVLADEHLTGAPRDAVEARLDLWLKTHVEKLLGPLATVEAAEDVTGIARGIAFQLVEALGVLERQKVADSMKSLDQTARATLRKYGVRFGAYHIYIPALLKPAPRLLALQLWALKQNEAELKGIDELPQLASSGRTSLKVDPEVAKSLYRTIGYRVCGERAVRVDILERLADAIRPALAWRPSAPGAKPPGAVDGSSFTITGTMTSLVGSSGEDFASILRSLGYRMEKRPKPPEPAPRTPSDAPAIDETPVALGVAPVAPEATEGDAQPDDDGIAPVVEAQAEAETAEAAAVEAAAVQAEPSEPVSTEAQPTEADPIPAEAEAAAPAEPTPSVDPVALDPVALGAVALGAAPLASAADAGASEAAPAAEAAATPAEEDMIEVWRPGRFEERRPPRQRPQRHKRPQHAQAPSGASDGTAPAVAAAESTPAPAGDAPAERPSPRGRDRGRERDQQRPPRPFPKVQHGGQEAGKDAGPDAGKTASKDGDRGAARGRGDRDRPRPERGRGRDRGGDQEWRQHLAPQRERSSRDKPPDPDSPFAKLAALKEQLEAKERR